ncbi:SMI1/KNR4 family protein [Streptomyces sp. NPDC002896]|uniref:SMI1/KNR4 family protein n=1 Tax=Streptomyces sp. NPDC002896 TaxID=3154438 RepID=UPI003319DFDD
MVERVARRIVEEIVASAPRGWRRAVLASSAGRGGTRVSGRYDVPGAPLWQHRVPNPFTELNQVAEALREDRGWEPVSLEIDCRPSGEYRLTAFTNEVTSQLANGGGFQAVLDTGYRLPQPGIEQEAGTASPAGDPERAVARFRTYLERRAAILGRPEQLPPPASTAALDEAERRLGHRLPADLRALYSIADGDGIDYAHRYLLGGYAWLTVEDLVAEHAYYRQPPWFGWDLGWRSVVFDTDPSDTVRRCGGHPAWLPFATGQDGNYLAVDLAPARNGHPGQVIVIGRDYDHGPAYVADSITSLLGRCLELLEQGSYKTYDDHISLRAPARSVAPREIIGAIPQEVPPTLQAIHINDAVGPVELAPLTAAPNLRLLHLNRCSTADLTPIRTLPVESLRVTLDGDDLTALEGHRHLRSLEVGTTLPIDIAPLRTIPNLRGLDLSQADVRDLTVLAGLPHLRYLALTTQQWTTLLDQGKAPLTLAAARLADQDASFDEALTWAARLGLNTGDALRVTGTFGSDGG